MDEVKQQGRSARRSTLIDRAADVEWWAIIVIMIAAILVFRVLYDEQTRGIWNFLKDGIAITVQLTFTAYPMAITIGALMGLARVAKNRVLYNISSLYVEVVRGIPMLVLLYWISFALLPLIVNWLDETFNTGYTMRDMSNVFQGAIALAIGYGAYSAEIFRAGIQSIEKGQYEASRALGMNYYQTMRYIVLPQALRRVLPALGNDFISMVKDSALVSVLGVRELTQATRLYSNSTFIYLPTWTLAAFIYLGLTVLMTRLVRLMERRLNRGYG